MALLWQILILLLVVAVVIEAIVQIAVMRQVGGILMQLRPARVGEIEGEGPELGQVVEFDGLDPARPAMVLFLSPDCQICRPLVSAIPSVERHYDELKLVTIVTGNDETRRAAYAKNVGSSARLDLKELMSEWSIPGTPFAVGIDGSGIVSKSGVVNSLDQLEALAEFLLRSKDSEVSEAEFSAADREQQNDTARRNGSELRREGEVVRSYDSRES
jgi:hypothetical protein